MASQRKLRLLIFVRTLLFVFIASAPGLALAQTGAEVEGISPDTLFYVPQQNHGAKEALH